MPARAVECAVEHLKRRAGQHMHQARSSSSTTPFISLRSITMPPVFTEYPAVLCPPERTDTARPASWPPMLTSTSVSRKRSTR